MPATSLNIVQVISPSKIAGAERSTLRLTHELAARGHRVSLVCKAGHELVEVARSEGIDTHGLEISGKMNLAAPFRLAAFVRRRGVDLIATQLSTASLWGGVAGRALGVPVVATVRALNTKTCYRFADRTIAVSAAVRQHLVDQGSDARRIDVVYNGIDLDRFGPVADPGEAKHAVGIPADHTVLGVVAHLTKKKGHDWFLRAAAPLVRSRPKCTLLFLGSGDEHEALRALAERLGVGGQLVMPGFQHDIRPWMGAMDVVTLPAIAKEGFGRVLVEAGAMHKPVITSETGGVVEVVEHNVTGLIAATGDEQALRSALAELIDDRARREQMGAAGRRRAEERFTVQQTAANTEAVYLRTLAASHKRAAA